MPTRRTVTFLIPWLVGSLLVGAALAERIELKADCDDELWILSTRHLQCPCSRFHSKSHTSTSHTGMSHTGMSPGLEFEVRRHDSAAGWQPESVDALLEDEPSVVTAVYVHGNRIEADEVEYSAFQAYEGLRCSGAPRTRVIFWSWPSDKIRGQMRDIRYKIHRSACESHYLAEFLCRQASNRRLVLVGYSLGARVAVGAMQLLGGGSLEPEGVLLDCEEAPNVRVAVSLMAPAIKDHSLFPEGRSSLATRQMDDLQVLHNSLDPVLKRFWLTDRSAHPSAMGYSGIPFGCGELGVPNRQYDLRDEIGRAHHFRHYFSSCEITELLRSQIRARAEY